MAQKGTVIKMEDTAKAIRDTYTRIKTSDYCITQKKNTPIRYRPESVDLFKCRNHSRNAGGNACLYSGERDSEY